MGGHNIITIGASAGGVTALRKLTHGLAPDLPASVFVVLHSRGPASLLPRILTNALPALEAVDLQKIQPRKIYVSRPDHHLLLEDKHMRVVHGPKENGYRPSIDVLFRSAATTCGARVVGVVLSGSLNDGAAGLIAIEKAGGVTIVQDPADAEFPEMPRNALQAVKVDYCVPLAQIPTLLNELAVSPAKTLPASTSNAMKDPRTFGKPSVFTCPDCNGTLWEFQEGELTEFRCRVGHAYALSGMEQAKSQATEDALWAAVRSLEEKAELARRISSHAQGKELENYANFWEARAQKSEHDAALIRKMLEEGDGPADV